MSRHGKLRENKCCENCGHYVEKRFCPDCGQENIETRQPFHYLFTVSIEDFIHYDSRFWKTILYLLFFPARLTKIYLSGKRKQYVPPVTLYIFISFITFFIPSILPDKNKEKEKISQESTTVMQENDNQDDNQEILSKSNNYTINIKDKKITPENLDKSFEKEKFLERLAHDFPKAIFLYMPIFAFWLWLFHNKKKWFYFDHGIYTIHYFSFILLSCLLFILFQWNYSYFGLGKYGWVKITFVISSIVMIFYFIYYFFHSHRMVYKETKAISRIKCIFLFLINSFCMFIFLISYMIVELYLTNKDLFMAIQKEIIE